MFDGASSLMVLDVGLELRNGAQFQYIPNYNDIDFCHSYTIMLDTLSKRISVTDVKKNTNWKYKKIPELLYVCP